MRQGGTLVLGVGNLLWADEGFGVRCVERFAQDWSVPGGVEVMDGGTQGLGLVNDLAEARNILIFDAVDAGLEPAELVTVRGDDVPRFVAGKKVSLHQTSMMEILALAELMADGAPDRLTLIGCQPVELEDYGGGLTPAVAARVDEAIARAIAELTDWGVPPRAAGRSGLAVMPEAVRQRPYESQRPDASLACRVGDERVLARAARAEG